ncbi:MAG: hypothetical protein AUH81_10295 [Candidatus Rokubacteria bacterium 13_1_40CM_4_69_5]|nr:MAG: hypothetical protein AUH81_10295 [Candidatus Rokubacteria bacterium 13_1_40CM_4_69_5]
MIVACAIGLAAPAAWAQATRRPADPQPLEGPRLAPLVLRPTLTLEEEYNDNVLLNNNDKRWDFITRFTPGLALEVEQPVYRLSAAYSFSAEIFAREPGLTHVFDQHRFILDGLYRVSPPLTLNLSDTFSLTTNTNLLAAEGVATGRSRGYSNALSGGAAWQFDPRTTLRGGASWTVLRFERRELRGSDVYRANVDVDRALTRRLNVTLGYEFGFLDVEREENLTTHTPRLGLTYRFTETLTGSVVGGPTFEVSDRDNRVTPTVSASLRQRLKWGFLSADYSRTLGTAAGLGGPTINQSVGASAQLATLTKGLTVEFGPRYSIVESQDNRNPDRIDVKSLSLPLSATYRFTRWLALVASYQFFHQRSDSRITDVAGASLANDVDQNRISIGLQFGYPIRFD